MRRNFAAVGGGEPGRALPARNAANAIEIEHDIIRSIRLQRGRHGRKAGEILADLDWGTGSLRDARHVAVVVVPDRLFNPVDSLVIERERVLHGIRKCQRLIEVDH